MPIGKQINEFERQRVLELSDGRTVQVPKHKTVARECDNYEFAEGDQIHTFPLAAK